MQNGRGGPQIIPRPDRWHIGNPAPWGEQPCQKFSMALIEETLARRQPVMYDNKKSNYRRSAVLVPIYPDDNELWIILTRRSAMMKHHTHEVSFPGGNQEPEDVDAWATAVREANEEIGLDPSLPRYMGTLDSLATAGSNSLISPQVASLEKVPSLQANPIEVEEILHVSLTELLNPEIFREEIWEIQDGDMRRITFFELIGNTIWGATAAMLRQLLLTLLSIEEKKNFS